MAAAAAAVGKERPARGGRRAAAADEVQQLIIIQGYDGEFALDASAEDTAAATLQTLALAGQVARVVHITEDGQVIASGQAGSASGPQVLVVGGSAETPAGDVPLSPGCGAIVPQASPPALGDLAPPDPASALDALLCAVSELGGTDDKGRAGAKEVLLQLPAPDAPLPTASELPEASEPGPELVRPAQERAQAALKKVVQGVLQLAVCGDAGKEGVTQLIVDPEGGVQMVARDGPHLLLHETPGAPHAHGHAADSEYHQIIVTDELVQAMVQGAAGTFPDGPTHYIVTELPSGPQDPGVFAHTVLEAAESQELLPAGVPAGTEQLTSMVIYTQDGAPAATVIQSQRDGSGLQEA